MSKSLVTKFTGALTGFEETRNDLWDAEDYLKKICDSRRSPEVKDFLDDVTLNAINKNLEKDAASIKHIKYVSLRLIKDEIFEINIETDGSQPASVKKAFKILGGSKSNLDGLRGSKRRRSGTAYEYLVEVQCGDADGVTPGILRLVRLYEGLKLAMNNS